MNNLFVIKNYRNVFEQFEKDRMENNNIEYDEFFKVRDVLFIGDAGQTHGTWGSCAIIPGTDDYQIIKKAEN